MKHAESRARQAPGIRLKNFPARGSKPLEKFPGIFEAMASTAPRRSVTVNDYATFSRIGPLSRAVHQRIDKKQGVSSLQMDLDGPLRKRDVILAFSIQRRDFFREKIALVTSRHHKSSAVTRPDIGQSCQDIDLAATEFAVNELILVSYDRLLSSRMNGKKSASAPHGGKALIDE